jgi:hypothetical protein
MSHKKLSGLLEVVTEATLRTFNSVFVPQNPQPIIYRVSNCHTNYFDDSCTDIYIEEARSTSVKLFSVTLRRC